MYQRQLRSMMGCSVPAERVAWSWGGEIWGRGFFFRSGSKGDSGTQRPLLRRTELSHKAAVARKPHLDLFATPDLTGLHRQQVRIEIGPIRVAP